MLFVTECFKQSHHYVVCVRGFQIDTSLYFVSECLQQAHQCIVCLCVHQTRRILNRPLILQMPFVEAVSIRGVVSRKDKPRICPCDSENQDTDRYKANNKTAVFAFIVLIHPQCNQAQCHMQNVFFWLTPPCEMMDGPQLFGPNRTVSQPTTVPTISPRVYVGMLFCNVPLSSLLEFLLHFLTAARDDYIDI